MVTEQTRWQTAANTEVGGREGVLGRETESVY